MILLLYVEDIIFTGSSLAVLRSLISRLSSQFSMKDLGYKNNILGLSFVVGLTNLNSQVKGARLPTPLSSHC